MKKYIVLLAVILFSHFSHSQTTTWTFETGGRIHSTPVVQDGVLFIGSGDQKLYVINQATGEETWSFHSDGAIYSDVGVGGELV